MKEVAPEVVFHLAAQPLVRESYQDPTSTLATNVMGTAHVLEAARHTDSIRSVVVITTDKVYENRDWHFPYREIDPLGGSDPYSASKAASELVVATYRASFFTARSDAPCHVASARAGNVIGGGDWATDRLVPDCLRAFSRKEAVTLRYPQAVRPWQHVLEPLAGYLALAERLSRPDGRPFAQAWNFGPNTEDHASVERVVRMIATLSNLPYEPIVYSQSENPHEASLLCLDSTLARTQLHWRPHWPLAAALTRTIEWHNAWQHGHDMLAFSRQQISSLRSEHS
jgi:CDP-glucose 4,6-dehydratase